MAVFELAKRNSGFWGGKFFKRNPAILPGQEKFLSEPPKRYGKADVFIGAKLEISGWHFELINADDYALRYMELHPSEVRIKLIKQKKHLHVRL